MEFKKVNNNIVQINFKSIKVKAVVEVNPEGFITAKLVEGDNVQSFDRPGEYEVKGIQFVMQEEGESDFKGYANVLAIVDPNNISILFLANMYELSKNIKEKMPDANIIVAPLTNDVKLKSFIKKADPENVIFVKEFMGVASDEKSVAALQGEINLGNEAKAMQSVNIEEKDFGGEEEVLTIGYIIE